MEQSVFLDIIDYGIQKGARGVSVEALEKLVQAKESQPQVETGQDRGQGLVQHMLYECFDPSENGSGSTRYTLKPKYFFKYSIYKELSQAKNAAKSAVRHAYIAVGLCVLAMIVSMVSIISRPHAPARIDPADLKALVSAVHSPSQQEVKLDALQMAQILSAVGVSQSKSEKRSAAPRSPALIDNKLGQEILHHEVINQYFEENERATLTD